MTAASALPASGTSSACKRDSNCVSRPFQSQPPLVTASTHEAPASRIESFAANAYWGSLAGCLSTAAATASPAAAEGILESARIASIRTRGEASCASAASRSTLPATVPSAPRQRASQQAVAASLTERPSRAAAGPAAVALAKAAARSASCVPFALRHASSSPKPLLPRRWLSTRRACCCSHEFWESSASRSCGVSLSHRDFQSTGLPSLWEIRQIRPFFLSRRGSRKSTSPWLMTGLVQSAT